MLDDVLDVSGPPERTGKPRGADLLDGTVTLPLILARGATRRSGSSGAVTRREEAEAVCDRIAATGALDEAREQALAHVAAAKAGARRGSSCSEPSATHALRLVADGVVERYA